MESGEMTEKNTPVNDGKEQEPQAGENDNRETKNQGTDHEGGDGDQFPRPYVEKLRRENQTLRERARGRDTLEKQLFQARVKLDGRLADPDAFAWKDEYADPEALEAAITEAIERNPRLGSKAVNGDIGQGQRGGGTPSLIDIIRGMQ